VDDGLNSQQGLGFFRHWVQIDYGVSCPDDTGVLLPWGTKRLECEADGSFHVVLKSRICEAVLLVSPLSSWFGAYWSTEIALLSCNVSGGKYAN
jgi:hypothetical protein